MRELQGKQQYPIVISESEVLQGLSGDRSRTRSVECSVLVGMQLPVQCITICDWLLCGVQQKLRFVQHSYTDRNMSLCYVSRLNINSVN
jgi:hypothetical protein